MKRFLCVAGCLISATTLLCAAGETNKEPIHPALPIQRHLTLAPGEGNPRNSEGDFVRLKDGRWLYVYTHFTAGASDHATAFLASRESRDGGLTWSDKDEVVVPNEGGFNVMSVSLLRLKSGEIGLFYLRKNSLGDCRPVVRFSRDEARTWSAPVECITDQVGYYVLNNSRVIQLANGRLVMPTALHGFTKENKHPGEIVTYLSDDSGRTWRRSETVLRNFEDGQRIDLMEPGVAEVKRNRLLMVIRTRIGWQYFSESHDGGLTWSPARRSEFLSPDAPATLVKIPRKGDLLMIWNDHCDKPAEQRRARPPVRTPLAAAISFDGGRTWKKTKLLEDRPDSGYCYTAVAFAGDRVLLGYCAHASRWGLETAQISSFALRDLYR